MEEVSLRFTTGLYRQTTGLHKASRAASLTARRRPVETSHAVRASSGGRHGNVWEKDLEFETKLTKNPVNKPRRKARKQKQEPPEVKQVEVPQPKEEVKFKTTEEIYKELRKKRKIKNIELTEDIGRIRNFFVENYDE